MSFLAWPSAVVVLGVVFMLVFRAPISRFIDRTRSVSRKGVRAYEDPQLTAKKPDALAEFLESYHNPLLLEVEAAIESEIQDLGLTDPTDVRKALSKRLDVVRSVCPEIQRAPAWRVRGRPGDTVVIIGRMTVGRQTRESDRHLLAIHASALDGGVPSSSEFRREGDTRACAPFGLMEC